MYCPNSVLCARARDNSSLICNLSSKAVMNGTKEYRDVAMWEIGVWSQSCPIAARLRYRVLCASSPNLGCNCGSSEFMRSIIRVSPILAFFTSLLCIYIVNWRISISDRIWSFLVSERYCLRIMAIISWNGMLEEQCVKNYCRAGSASALTKKSDICEGLRACCTEKIWKSLMRLSTDCVGDTLNFLYLK